MEQRELTQMFETGSYIGDGIYVKHDGFMIWLGTQRDGSWHYIALEPEVLDALNAYNARIESKNNHEEKIE